MKTPYTAPTGRQFSLVGVEQRPTPKGPLVVRLWESTCESCEKVFQVCERTNRRKGDGELPSPRPAAFKRRYCDDCGFSMRTAALIKSPNPDGIKKAVEKRREYAATRRAILAEAIKDPGHPAHTYAAWKTERKKLRGVCTPDGARAILDALKKTDLHYVAKKFSTTVKFVARLAAHWDTPCPPWPVTTPINGVHTPTPPESKPTRHTSDKPHPYGTHGRHVRGATLQTMPFVELLLLWEKTTPLRSHWRAYKDVLLARIKHGERGTRVADTHITVVQAWLRAGTKWETDAAPGNIGGYAPSVFYTPEALFLADRDGYRAYMDQHADAWVEDWVRPLGTARYNRWLASTYL